MTSGKHLGSTPIMTSSIVPLNIHRITGKFYITCEQLGSPCGTGPRRQSAPESFLAGPVSFSLYSGHLYYNLRHQFAHPPHPSPATKISCFWHTLMIVCYIRGTRRLFSVKYLFGEANIFLKFSFTLGRLKISRWLFHSCTVFEAYLISPLRFSKV